MYALYICAVTNIVQMGASHPSLPLCSAISFVFVPSQLWRFCKENGLEEQQSKLLSWLEKQANRVMFYVTHMEVLFACNRFA